MTPLPNLDRLHAAATPGPWRGDVAERSIYAPGWGFVASPPEGRGVDTFERQKDINIALLLALRNAYPALRAYLKALEAERDVRSTVDREGATDGCCDECDVHMKRLKAARLATDAAREKMEKQDG